LHQSDSPAARNASINGAATSGMIPTAVHCRLMLKLGCNTQGSCAKISPDSTSSILSIPARAGTKCEEIIHAD